MKVHLEMPDNVARRLRAMCHRRGMTASELVARWVSEHDEAGFLKPEHSATRTVDTLFGDLFGSPFVR